MIDLKNPICSEVWAVFPSQEDPLRDQCMLGVEYSAGYTLCQTAVQFGVFMKLVLQDLVFGSDLFSNRSRFLHTLTVPMAMALLTLTANPVFAAGSITVEFNAPYNLVVDSNVCSPSTYAPRIGTIGAGFCNYGDAKLTDVVAHIGDFATQTPGIYPTRDSATGAGDVAVTSSCLADSGTYSLTHLGDLIDATHIIGDLEVGECSWQYWSFTYPRRENPDTCGDPVWCDTNDPNDDLYLDFDVWATSAEGAAADDTWTVTMRNEISAAANKIFPK
jgi:hypothetical protein